jgi:hypothetical protein
MEKTSAKRILCIRYKLHGKISGRLAAMKNWIHFSDRRGNGRKLCGKRTGRLQNPDSVIPHVQCQRAEKSENTVCVSGTPLPVLLRVKCQNDE